VKIPSFEADKQSSPNSSSLVANGYMNMLLGFIYIPYSFAYQFLASFATILGLRRTDQTQRGEEGQQQQRKTPKSDKKENDNKTTDSAGTSRVRLFAIKMIACRTFAGWQYSALPKR